MTMILRIRKYIGRTERYIKQNETLRLFFIQRNSHAISAAVSLNENEIKTQPQTRGMGNDAVSI